MKSKIFRNARYRLNRGISSGLVCSRFHHIGLVALIIIIIPFFSQGQVSVHKKYGIATISGLEAYKKLIAADSLNRLVDLKKFIPGIVLDIKYAKKDNFLGEAVYAKEKAFLNQPAAIALRKVQWELNEKGYGLKIFDAYRPYGITVLFYEKVRDTVFVASPYKGSRHNRGSAVDLTLIWLATGKDIKMPTAFDDFTKAAHAAYPALPASVIQHRELLKSMMTKYGFQVYENEWWHFDFQGWQNHPLLDISFETLINAFK